MEVEYGAVVVGGGGGSVDAGEIAKGGVEIDGFDEGGDPLAATEIGVANDDGDLG